MTARALDLEVLRNGRPLDVFQAHGDPQDIAWLQKRLQGWLLVSQVGPRPVGGVRGRGARGGQRPPRREEAGGRVVPRRGSQEARNADHKAAQAQAFAGGAPMTSGLPPHSPGSASSVHLLARRRVPRGASQEAHRVAAPPA